MLHCRRIGVVKFEVFDEFQDHEIIGVIEDYHHEAVKKETYPMVLKSNFNSYQQVYYSVRLQAGTSPQQAIDDIGAAWAQVFPEHPFEYFFLDDYYDQQFKTEIGMSATILLVPVMVIASTVMVISALQVVKAARVNPVEPLRSE